MYAFNVLLIETTQCCKNAIFYEDVNPMPNHNPCQN